MYVDRFCSWKNTEQFFYLFFLASKQKRERKCGESRVSGKGLFRMKWQLNLRCLRIENNVERTVHREREREGERESEWAIELAPKGSEPGLVCYHSFFHPLDFAYLLLVAISSYFNAANFTSKKVLKNIFLKKFIQPRIIDAIFLFFPQINQLFLNKTKTNYKEWFLNG